MQVAGAYQGMLYHRQRRLNLQRSNGPEKSNGLWTGGGHSSF